VSFETALNCIWLALGATALASTTRTAYRHSRQKKSASASLHVIGVALIVAALFPYISATDDVLRIEQLNSHHSRTDSSHRGPHDNLIRLYQTMDTPLVSDVKHVVLTLFFVSLVAAVISRRITRSAPFESGRSPPSLATV
jgi:branched-subunit amino acid ABC-type transport system permease component